MDHEESIAFRFATAFGVSPRMRLDLLLNNLVYDAVNQKYMVLYEAHFMRTFIHVRDIANSFLHAIENHKLMKNQIYNVGSDENNLSKLQLAHVIMELTNAQLHLADNVKDEDQRNYKVSYDKIKRTGFECSISIKDGVKELINAFDFLKEKSQYRNA